MKNHQNNIKEVLLFPAMKPDEAATQQQQSTSRGIGVVPQQDVGAAAAPAAAAASHAAVFANGSSLLQGVDLGSPAGMQKLEV